MKKIHNEENRSISFSVSPNMAEDTVKHCLQKKRWWWWHGQNISQLQHKVKPQTVPQVVWGWQSSERTPRHTQDNSESTKFSVLIQQNSIHTVMTSFGPFAHSHNSDVPLASSTPSSPRYPRKTYSAKTSLKLIQNKWLHLLPSHSIPRRWSLYSGWIHYRSFVRS